MKGKQDNIIEHTEILIDQVRLDSKLKVFLKAFESFSEKNSIFLKKKLSKALIPRPLIRSLSNVVARGIIVATDECASIITFYFGTSNLG